MSIYQYFVNIFLEMSYIILYLANFLFQSQIARTKFRRVEQIGRVEKIRREEVAGD